MRGFVRIKRPGASSVCLRAARNVFMLCRGGRFAAGATTERPTTHADVTATALAHLGVALDPAWRLDGKPAQQ